MNLNKLVLAASVAAVLSTAGVANASTALTFSGGAASFANTNTGSIFDDFYTFSIPLSNTGSATASTISGYLLFPTVADTVSFTSFQLFSGAPSSGALVASGTLQQFITPGGLGLGYVGATSLASGNYYIEVKGTAAPGFVTGNYSGNVNLTLAPVPEPESYAMLLAGLGLMGTIARRRSKVSKS